MLQYITHHTIKNLTGKLGTADTTRPEKQYKKQRSAPQKILIKCHAKLNVKKTVMIQIKRNISKLCTIFTSFKAHFSLGSPLHLPISRWIDRSYIFRQMFLRLLFYQFSKCLIIFIGGFDTSQQGNLLSTWKMLPCFSCSLFAAFRPFHFVFKVWSETGVMFSFSDFR